ncbi:hypothetical protein Pcinc_019149 [Petrolisthes cinctipes]|uniref:E3 ubiquitin-protein ligase TM129 n=1 Tax=Petrolisthes cinctipes TaxID=88211 RepID=A0AAE1KI47_PETCI|nr:hypothetical protein Pcinc_036836 [Petrolisthes cinctipes]KAK3876006.1 hypothetical protein Pcinc_019149 [Petrolisthes cinctipes]
MLGPLLLATAVYCLVVLAIVFPPTEMVSAGLTVEGVLDSWLGSENINFIQYHIHRTTARIFIHSLLFPGYGGILVKYHPEVVVWIAQLHPTLPLLLLLLVCVIPPLAAGVTVAIWRQNHWRLHPLTRTLAALARPGQTWRAVAAEINSEFRGIDKFTYGSSSSYRLVATDSWLILVGCLRLRLIRHRDAVLALTGATDTLGITSPAGTTMVRLRVTPVREGTKPFYIRVNSMSYSELERKLAYPVVNPRGLVVKSSLVDRFLPVFMETVNNNPVLPANQEESSMCIGCMATEANVKLQRRCGRVEDGGGGGNGLCAHCDCRPLWCITCLSKWFAARQDQNSPETWLGSRAPCPTCRATFCMLDVSLITPPQV